MLLVLTALVIVLLPRSFNIGKCAGPLVGAQEQDVLAFLLIQFVGAPHRSSLIELLMWTTAN